MRVYLKNSEAGFTLLEALIAMMLSSAILLLLSTSIQQLSQINKLIIADAQFVSTEKSKIRGSRQVEWHLFLNQLEGYLENTELISSTSRSLVVLEKTAGSVNPLKIKYEQSKTGYRSFSRSKNNGHNAMLTDIKSFHLIVDGQWLLLSFTFQNDEEYQGRIWVESWEEKSHPEKN